jgi:hypothetical protein
MRVGDLEYFTVFMRIRDMSSSWFDPATEIPLLAEVPPSSACRPSASC